MQTLKLTCRLCLLLLGGNRLSVVHLHWLVDKCLAVGCLDQLRLRRLLRTHTRTISVNAKEKTQCNGDTTHTWTGNWSSCNCWLPCEPMCTCWPEPWGTACTTICWPLALCITWPACTTCTWLLDDGIVWTTVMWPVPPLPSGLICWSMSVRVVFCRRKRYDYYRYQYVPPRYRCTMLLCARAAGWTSRCGARPIIVRGTSGASNGSARASHIVVVVVVHGQREKSFASPGVVGGGARTGDRARVSRRTEFIARVRFWTPTYIGWLNG